MSFRYKHGDRLLDDYTLQRGVGRGAFGEVYYAVSDGGREVALKTILQNPDIELRGIQHCINLKSPHLVSIFDVKKSEEGVPVVIMEYVAGPSLRDLLHEHPSGLGAQRAAYLLREVAKGLAYLHERGIVHRDLKPENLFYEDGYVKIGDYGLSKYVSVSRQSGQTMSVGTVHYMAPEIGSGIYNQSIDIYALGVILHELLTGTVPFTGDSFGEILMKHLTADPDLSGIDAPFRDVIAKALRKKPEERYQSVEEMARELFEDVQLTQSVHSFNPATLSIQPRRLTEQQAAGLAQQGAVGGVVSEAVAEIDPAARTSPVGAAPPPPPPPPRTRVPSGWPPRTAKQESPTTPSPGNTATARTEPRHEARREPPPVTPGTFEDGGTSDQRSRPEAATKTVDAYEEAERLDPLELPQRLSRVAFTLFGCAAAMSALDLVSNGLQGLLGVLLISATGTWSVIYTERTLARQHKISEGWPRRLIVVALSLFPVAWATDIARFANVAAAESATIPILLCIFLIDWRTRLDPYREERLLWGDAISAGLLGFFFGMLFVYGPGTFVIAVMMGTISLALNAFAPFVPQERRRSRPGARAAESEPSSPTAQPAAPSNAAPAQSAPPRRNRSVGLDKPGGDPHAAHRSSPAAEAAWARAGSVSAASPVELPGKAPGHLAKVFWLFVGALFLAGGLCCLIIPLAVELHPDLRLLLPSVFLGSMGYKGFCLYRALWVRKRGLWSRTVRPFILTSLGNAFAINTYLFIIAPIEAGWRYQDDELLIVLCMAITSPILIVLILGFDHVARFDRDAFLHASHLPRAERPVHPIVRLAQLFASISGAIFAASAVIVAFFAGNVDEWDRAGLLSTAVGSSVFAVFFAHQGLRYRRGHLWESSVRPLVLSTSLAAIGACGVFLILQPQSYQVHHGRPGEDLVFREVIRAFPEEETILCVVLTIVAAVLGSFAFFVRGPRRDLAASRICWWQPAPGQEARKLGTGSGWSGLGIVLWILAFAVTALAGAVRCGLFETLELHRELGVQDLERARPFLSTGWIALVAAFAASWFIQLGRRECGLAHWTRGAIGQLLIVGAGAAFLHACGWLQVGNVTGRLVFESGGDNDRVQFLLNLVVAVGIIGALFLLWPNRRSDAREELPAESPLV